MNESAMSFAASAPSGASTFLEMEIEERTIDILRNTLSGVAPGITFTGAWAQVAEGEVKGEEKPADSIAVAVAVSAPQWDDYLSPVLSIPVSVAVAVRRETSPTGAALAAVCAPLSNLLRNFQQDIDATTENFLTASFVCNGFRFNGGPPPVFNKASGAWTFTRQFTLRGTVREVSGDE